jgi:hypothetical protein
MIISLTDNKNQYPHIQGQSQLLDSKRGQIEKIIIIIIEKAKTQKQKNK